MQPQNIVSLIRLIQKSQPHQVPHLIESLMEYSVSYVYKILKKNNNLPERDLDDIVQDICIEIYSSIYSLNSPQAFWSWCRRIILTKVANYYREKMPQLPLNDQEVEWYYLDAEYIFHQYTNFENEFYQYQRKLFWSAFIRLPVNNRKALYLKYCVGYQNLEVAKQMGKGLSTIKGYIKDGIQEMKDYILQEELQRLYIAGGTAK